MVLAGCGATAPALSTPGRILLPAPGCVAVSQADLIDWEHQYLEEADPPTAEWLFLHGKRPPDLHLFDVAGRVPYPRLRNAILDALLEERPHHPVLLAARADSSNGPAERAALSQAAAQAASTNPTRPAEGGQAGSPEYALITRGIEALLDAGLGEQAVEAYEAVAPELRSRIASGETGKTESVFDKLPFREPPADLRAALAAAFWLQGRYDVARDLLPKGLPPLTPCTPEATTGQPPSIELLRNHLVRSLLEPEDRQGAFEVACWWLHRTLPLREEPDGAPKFSATLDLAVETLLERVGAHGSANRLLRDIAGALGCGPDAPVVQELPAAAFPFVRDFEQELSALCSDIFGRVNRLQDPEPDPGDVAGRAVQRSLAAPRVFPYRVLEQDAPPPVDAEEDDAALEFLEDLPDAIDDVLPRGFESERIEIDGESATVLATSANSENRVDFDYWVLLSKDLGATWERPLATGLHPASPWEPSDESSVALIEGDRLRIEAFPSFPIEDSDSDPAAVILEARLEDLRKDRDGDGLTDIEESWLATDANNEDTDRDGLTDAEDPMPQVPELLANPSLSSRALAAVLSSESEWAGIAVFAADVAGGGPVKLPRPATPVPGELWDPTLFVIGNRSRFEGMTASRRVIVLSEAEAEAWMSKFGGNRVLRVEDLLLDPREERALIRWTYGYEPRTRVIQLRLPASTPS